MSCLLERSGLQRSIASTMPSSSPPGAGSHSAEEDALAYNYFSADYKSWEHMVYRLCHNCFPTIVSRMHEVDACHEQGVHLYVLVLVRGDDSGLLCRGGGQMQSLPVSAWLA